MVRAYLTVGEVAELLRVNRKTVYSMIEAGQLVHLRAGKLIRVPITAVQDLLEPRPEMP